MVARPLALLDLGVTQAGVVDRARLDRPGHQGRGGHDDQQGNDGTARVAGHLHHQHDGGDRALGGRCDHRCAAEQGEPAAQFFLGLLYDRGQGVAENPVEAEKWLDLAAARAPKPKREYWATMRDTIAGKMTLDELAEARRRAVAWYPLRER